MAEKVEKEAFNTLFGWCGSGHHESCRVQFADSNKKQHTCTCKCHTKS